MKRLHPLYIITARGGSRGIPRKNVRPMAGRPLIAYTLDAAKEAQAQAGGYILVSTDDTEIADAARAEGVTVDYMRPSALGGDTVGSREVLLDAMNWASAQGIAYDVVVLLQPTSPFRTGADILQTLRLYAASDDADMVVSVCESGSNPYFSLFETATDGTLHISKGDGLYTRRQDCPKVYEFNGAVYAIRPASLRAMPLGAFPRRLPYVMPPERSLDLDTPADWAICEAMMLSLKK